MPFHRLPILDTTITDLESDLTHQTAAMVQMNNLEKAIAAKRVLYENLRNRLQETSVQTHMQRADSRLTSNAALLKNPIAPNKSRLMALGLFFGSAIGIAVTLIRNIRAPKVTSAARLSALTNLPVLASLPKFPFATRVQKVPLPGATTADGEAIRSLRNALVLRKTAGPEAGRIIMVTSAASGEGKTTIATALAASFGQAGSRVLLIDCDTRRCMASLRLTHSPEFGLADILMGDCTLNQAVLPTDYTGMDVLPALSAMKQTSGIDALDRGELGAVLDQARQSWDIIILDTPPAMVISDTLLLSQEADIRLLLASCAETSEAEVLTCVDRLRQLGQGPDALVINKSRNAREIYGKGRKSSAYFKPRIAA